MLLELPLDMLRLILVQYLLACDRFTGRFVCKRLNAILREFDSNRLLYRVHERTLPLREFDDGTREDYPPFYSNGRLEFGRVGPAPDETICYRAIECALRAIDLQALSLLEWTIERLKVNPHSPSLVNFVGEKYSLVIASWLKQRLSQELLASSSRGMRTRAKTSKLEAPFFINLAVGAAGVGAVRTLNWIKGSCSDLGVSHKDVFTCRSVWAQVAASGNVASLAWLNTNKYAPGKEMEHDTDDSSFLEYHAGVGGSIPMIKALRDQKRIWCWNEDVDDEDVVFVSACCFSRLKALQWMWDDHPASVITLEESMSAAICNKEEAAVRWLLAHGALLTYHAIKGEEKDDFDWTERLRALVSEYKK